MKENEIGLKLVANRIGLDVGVVADGTRQCVDPTITLFQAGFRVIEAFMPSHLLKSKTPDPLVWDYDDAGLPIKKGFSPLVPFYCTMVTPSIKREIWASVGDDFLWGSVAFHETSRRAPETLVGVGSIVDGYGWFSHDIIVGVLANIGSHVHIGAGTRIGDFATIGANVTILIDCEIGHEVEIGAGAIVWPRVKIGDKTKIRPGAIVKQDIVAHEVF